MAGCSLVGNGGEKIAVAEHHRTICQRREDGPLQMILAVINKEPQLFLAADLLPVIEKLTQPGAKGAVTGLSGGDTGVTVFLKNSGESFELAAFSGAVNSLKNDKEPVPALFSVIRLSICCYRVLHVPHIYLKKSFLPSIFQE